MSNIVMKHNETDHRYEAWVGENLAGFAQYRQRDEAIVIPHTEVKSAYEGQGIGSKIARFALDDVRAQGASVIPSCPFIAGWIERHPEYADLVDKTSSQNMP